MTERRGGEREREEGEMANKNMEEEEIGSKM